MTLEQIVNNLSPQDYEKKMKIILHGIYNGTPIFEERGTVPVRNFSEDDLNKGWENYPKWVGGVTVLQMRFFQAPLLAAHYIREWLSAGGISLGHFNRNYTKLIIYRDEFTEEIVEHKIREAKAKKEVQRSGVQAA